ncbi:MAG: hypothetical protein HY731_05555, partial [Candidatus Tectomicrobia bacterium]|nr:hypothetical protein [Candidatus Tectomicrobia bacterium]
FRGQFKGQPDQQAYASIIVQEVDRLNRVIRDLLEFAKPREPLLEPQSLQDILHHALTLIGPDASAKGIKVVEEIDERVSQILLDRDQFTQALLNILLNAIESMGEGGILTCSLHCEDGVERWLELLIADTGSGIPPEDLPKIFDPFFTTKKRGTGLGLAIAQQIIEGHGGEIRVESQIGQGTTFAITLPIKENPQI